MNKTKDIGFREFVTLMASLIAMVALSIDVMLPALRQIGEDLNAANPNDPQLIIGLFFFGMAFAQLVYGPLSDSFGRRPMIFLGMAIYLAGSALCLVSDSLYALIVGRIIQGVGAAGPRIVANAIIRDRYEGRTMASVSSLVMTGGGFADLEYDPFAGEPACQRAPAFQGGPNFSGDLGSAAQSFGVWLHGYDGIGVCLFPRVPEFCSAGFGRGV